MYLCAYEGVCICIAVCMSMCMLCVQMCAGLTMCIHVCGGQRRLSHVLLYHFPLYNIGQGFSLKKLG